MRMTVMASGSVHEKIRKTSVGITTLFDEEGLESQLAPIYAAALLQPFDVLITVGLEKPTSGILTIV